MPTVDNLITELISSGRQASTEELAVIIADAAKAPFATYWSRVPIELRELLAERGIVVPTRLPSLQRHLLKRIYGEEQWPVGTTAEQYIADLHQAVTHPVVQIWTYRYLAQPFAGFLAPSHVQGGVRPERYIFVAYNPTYKTLTTGYQASDVQSIFTAEYTDLVRHQ